MIGLNIFLASVGFVVTVLVLTGMVFLKPHHLIEAEVLTDLSDITPHVAIAPVLTEVAELPAA